MLKPLLTLFYNIENYISVYCYNFYLFIMTNICVWYNDHSYDWWSSDLQWLLLLPPEFLSGWNRVWQRVTVQSWPAPRLWCQEVWNLFVLNHKLWPKQHHSVNVKNEISVSLQCIFFVLYALLYYGLDWLFYIRTI